MPEDFAGFTATAHCKPDHNFGHNARIDNVAYNEEHIGIGEHETWIGGKELSAQKLFNEVFVDAVEKYNAGQKRSDRKIKNYYQKVKDDGRFGKTKTLKYGKQKQIDISRKPIYEFVIQVGNREEHPEAEEVKPIFKSFIENVWSEKFGRNFRLVRVDYHDDEYSEDKDGEYTIKSPAHIHVDFVPVVIKTPEELKGKGVLKMELQHSLSQACEQAGFQTDHLTEEERKVKIELKEKINEAKKNGNKELKEKLQNQLLAYTTLTNQQRFEEAVRHAFAEHCQENGIKIDLTPRKKHSHQNKDLFKINKEREKLENEKKIHNEQKNELEKKEEEFNQHIEKFSKEVEDIKIKKQKLEKQEKEIEKREIEQADLIVKEQEIKQFLEENKIENPDFNFNFEVPELLPPEDGFIISESRSDYAHRNLENFKQISEQKTRKTKNIFSRMVDCVKYLWGENKKLRKENKEINQKIDEEVKEKVDKACSTYIVEKEKNYKIIYTECSVDVDGEKIECKKGLLQGFKNLYKNFQKITKELKKWKQKTPEELEKIANEMRKNKVKNWEELEHLKENDGRSGMDGGYGSR